MSLGSSATHARPPRGDRGAQRAPRRPQLSILCEWGALGRRHVRGGAGARPAARGAPGPQQPPPSGRPCSPRARGPDLSPPSSPASAAQRPFYGRKAGKPRPGRHPVAVLASCSSHRPCGLTGGYEAQTRGGAPEAMEDSRGARRRSSPRGRPPRTSTRSQRRPCRRGLCWAAPSRGVAPPHPVGGTQERQDIPGWGPRLFILIKTKVFIGCFLIAKPRHTCRAVCGGTP